MPQLILPPLAIDAAETGGPLYTSEAIRSALGAVLAGGTTPGRTRTGALGINDFQVTLSGSAVSAAPGGYAIGTGAGAYINALNATFAVGTLAPADATNPRIDLVVLRIDDPANGGASARTGSIELLTGTPSASPSRPVVTGTAVYALLAQIAVPRSGGGAAVVTDLRTWTAGTGGIVPFRTTSEITSWSAPAGTLAYSVADGKTYIRQVSTWKTLLVEEDTGWVSLPPTTGQFVLYGTSPIQIRNKNGVVQFTGAVKPAKAGDLADFTSITTIPAAFRSTSSYSVMSVQQGSSQNRWCLNIANSGVVKGERYGVASPVDVGTATWLPFSVVWLV